MSSVPLENLCSAGTCSKNWGDISTTDIPLHRMMVASRDLIIESGVSDDLEYPLIILVTCIIYRSPGSEPLW